MKHCVKKIYCDSCSKLVAGKEQTINSYVHVSCANCGKLLWIWNGATWRDMSKNTRQASSAA